MTRYLKLYLYFMRFSISRSLEFRMDFYFRIVMDVIYYAVNIAFFKVIFLHTSSVGGWTEPQSMIFVAGYLIVDAIQMTIFSNNFWMLPDLINKGGLDYYLLRPVSSLFFVSLRDFAVNSFVNLVMTIGILAWAIHQSPTHFGILEITLFSIYLLIGTCVFYSLRMLVVTMTFWTNSPRGHEGLFWPMSRIMERPDRIYQGFLRGLFVTLLPFCLMASFPARLILDPFDWSIFTHFIGGAVIFLVATIWFWNKGLSNYSSASS